MSAKSLSLLLILSLGALGVFGFLWIDALHITHTNCIISALLGGDCSLNKALTLASHHISGLKDFTEAALGSTFMIFAGWLFMALALFFGALFYDSAGQETAYLKTDEIRELTYRSMRHWFAVRNKPYLRAPLWACR